MAYDRYDMRGRERWRSDERGEDRFRERDRGRRDERGFFERAGEEIRSWFGDEDDDRRRSEFRGREQRDFEREPGRRDFGRDFRESRTPSGWGGDWEREREFGRGRDRDEDRGFLSSASYRGHGGEGGEGGRGGALWQGERSGEYERGYRPLAGDYGRSDRRDRGRGAFDRDDYRRTSFAGSSERSGHDPHYSEWRRRQMDELDRDYDDYRREHQSKFEQDFGSWRERRQSKRRMLGEVREHMEVVGSDEQHVGTVDRVAGDRIILTKSDEEAGGRHHSVPCTMVDRIEENRVFLDCKAEDAKARWRDDDRERALFERDDQGEAGPMTLERSFSGTYR